MARDLTRREHDRRDQQTIPAPLADEHPDRGHRPGQQTTSPKVRARAPITDPGALYTARTMQALELLSFQDLSVPQLAATMQIHPRTARRLVLRLANDDYIEQTHDHRRRYRATLRLAALASQLLAHHHLPRVAAPHLTQLSESTGATAHLYIPAYQHVACVLHRDHPPHPDQPLGPALRERLPAHATAPGRVLLAHRQPWRDNILTRPLERFTDRTLTTRPALELDAARIRRHGYAIEHGEHHPHTHAIAAPIHTLHASTPAAIAITTTSDTHDPVLALVAHVTRAAAAISHDLTATDTQRPTRPR